MANPIGSFFHGGSQDGKSILPAWRFIVDFLISESGDSIKIDDTFAGIQPYHVVDVSIPFWSFRGNVTMFGSVPKSFTTLDMEDKGLQLDITFEEDRYGRILKIIQQLQSEIINESGIYRPLHSIPKRKIQIRLYDSNQGFGDDCAIKWVMYGCRFVMSDSSLPLSYASSDVIKYKISFSVDSYSTEVFGGKDSNNTSAKAQRKFEYVRKGTAKAKTEGTKSEGSSVDPKSSAEYRPSQQQVTLRGKNSVGEFDKIDNTSIPNSTAPKMDVKQAQAEPTAFTPPPTNVGSQADAKSSVTPKNQEQSSSGAKSSVTPKNQEQSSGDAKSKTEQPKTDIPKASPKAESKKEDVPYDVPKPDSKAQNNPQETKPAEPSATTDPLREKAAQVNPNIKVTAKEVDAPKEVKPATAVTPPSGESSKSDKKPSGVDPQREKAAQVNPNIKVSATEIDGPKAVRPPTTVAPTGGESSKSDKTPSGVTPPEQKQTPAEPKSKSESPGDFQPQGQSAPPTTVDPQREQASRVNPNIKVSATKSEGPKVVEPPTEVTPTTIDPGKLQRDREKQAFDDRVKAQRGS